MRRDEEARPPLSYPVTPRHVPTPGGGTTDERKRYLGSLRLTISGIVYVALASILLKAFFGDSFVIPTVSMEPTIVGHPEVGDRVLSSRLPYLVGDPQRWDVALFRYGNNRSIRFMKRIVGIGGEQLIILGGDLWRADSWFTGDPEEGRRQGRLTILRKPADLQRELFEAFPLIPREELLPWDLQRLNRHFALAADQVSCWREVGGAVEVESDVPALAWTRREARDFIYDPLAGNDGQGAMVVAGRHAVGDLSLAIDVRPETAGGRILLEIEDTTHREGIRAAIAVAGSGETTTLSLGGRVIATSRVGIDPRRWTGVRLQNADDRIVLSVDDEVVLVRDYTHPFSEPETGPPAGSGRGTAGFGGAGGRFRFRSPRIGRDLFYIAEGETRFLIPEGHYLCLGDNSPSSADSRSWKRTALEVLETGEILEGDHQGVSLRHVQGPGSNPWQEPDGQWAFVDEHGTIHRFASPDAFRVLGSWATPYVARELIHDRGMAVIAPWSRAHWLR